MYKVAGSVPYPWLAVSPSDPNRMGLGYHTEDQAARFASSINESLDTFDTDPTWNKEYWKTKPEPWVVVKA
jgi:hypothetical protein